MANNRGIAIHLKTPFAWVKAILVMAAVILWALAMLKYGDPAIHHDDVAGIKRTEYADFLMGIAALCTSVAGLWLWLGCQSFYDVVHMPTPKQRWPLWLYWTIGSIGIVMGITYGLFQNLDHFYYPTNADSISIPIFGTMWFSMMEWGFFTVLFLALFHRMVPGRRLWEKGAKETIVSGLWYIVIALMLAYLALHGCSALLGGYWLCWPFILLKVYVLLAMHAGLRAYQQMVID